MAEKQKWARTNVADAMSKGNKPRAFSQKLLLLTSFTSLLRKKFEALPV